MNIFIAHIVVMTLQRFIVERLVMKEHR